MNRIMREQMVACFRKGWHLIPLKEHSKKPNLPVGHPYLRVTPNSDDYANFQFHNYGIICGPISGICVLDVDGDEGRETLKRKGISTVDFFTPCVLTPNDGEHYFFQHDPRIRTGANVIGPGVDIRSHGGYVVGPGSEIVDESTGELKTYRWKEGYDLNLELEVPPEFMHRKGGEFVGINADQEIGDMIGEGNRNNTFTSLAGTLFRRLDGRRLPQSVIFEMLQVVNRRMCKPPLDDVELEAIVKSIGRKEAT